MLKEKIETGEKDPWISMQYSKLMRVNVLLFGAGSQYVGSMSSIVLV
jgi:hypothetical protein